jgi:predicted peptidase
MKWVTTSRLLVAGIVAMTLMQRCERIEAENRLVPHEVVTKYEVIQPLKYWLYLPERYDAQEKWPLVVFLHGAGERGDDLELVKTHGPPKEIIGGKSFPFVMVAPQCPRTSWWAPGAINDLTRQLAKQYKIDPQRIYLTGLSMGGYGSWAAAVEAPDLYAAIAPICGGGDAAKIAVLKDLPIWAFHGAKDPTVPLSASQQLVDALQAAGSDIKFTVYPETAHDSWTETYQNPALYDWLLQHQRAN